MYIQAPNRRYTSDGQQFCRVPAEHAILLARSQKYECELAALRQRMP